jgi:hypothetical protein
MTPAHGLQRIKRYLRRHCRKPVDMPVREFWANFSRINYQEIPKLPPMHDHEQSLQKDEVIDILLYAFPKSWQSKMTEQGFDPFAAGINALIQFAQRMEESEQIKGEKGQKRSSPSYSSDSRKKSKDKRSYQIRTDGTLYCKIHGKGNHKTDDCKQIAYLLKKSEKKDDNGFKSKNKTWKKDDYKKKSKEEVKAVQETERHSKSTDSDASVSSNDSMHSAQSSLSENSESLSVNMLQQEVKGLNEEYDALADEVKKVSVKKDSEKKTE